MRGTPGRWPPRPLALLLVAVAMTGAAWALLVPGWQGPDEPAHFSYAQGLAEDFELPGVKPSRIYSTEVDLSLGATQADSVQQNLFARAEWDERVYGGWRTRSRLLPPEARADGGGRTPGGRANPARTNPPLYYMWETIPYLAASDSDVFGRLYLMRLWSVLLLLVSTAAAWMLVGEVLGRRPLLQLVGAATAGLQPMACATSASISPDAMLIAAWSVALWLGARTILRGVQPAASIGLALAVAVGVVTKATGYALVPAAGFAVLAGLRRSRRGSGVRSLVLPAGAAAALLVPVVAWLLTARGLGRAAINQVAGLTQTSGVNLGDLASYLWQFYLPKLPGQDPFPVITSLPVYDNWVTKGWAAFGWLEVRLPEAVYVLLAGVSLALVVGAVAALTRRRREGGLGLLGFFGLAALVLLAGLHWVEFQVITLQGAGFNQGRYLLPLLPLIGLGAAGLIERLRPGARALAVGLVLGALAVLQLSSLTVVASRFYA